MDQKDGDGLIGLPRAQKMRHSAMVESRSTPLIDSVRAGDTHTALAAIKRHKGQRDDTGMTALMLAAQAGNSVLVHKLAKHEGSIRTPERVSALMFALEAGSLPCSLILAQHCDCDCDANGQSVFDYALRGKSLECMQCLVLYYKPELETLASITSQARRRGLEAIAEYLDAVQQNPAYMQCSECWRALCRAARLYDEIRKLSSRSGGDPQYVGALEKQVEDLRDMVATQNRRLMELEGDSRGMSKRRDEGGALTSVERRQLQDLVVKLSEANCRCEALEQELLAERNRSQSYSPEQSPGRINDLETRNAQLEDDCAAANETISNMRNVINTLKSEIESKNVILRQARDVIQQQKNLISGMTTTTEVTSVIETQLEVEDNEPEVELLRSGNGFPPQTSCKSSALFDEGDSIDTSGFEFPQQSAVRIPVRPPTTSLARVQSGPSVSHSPVPEDGEMRVEHLNYDHTGPSFGGKNESSYITDTYDTSLPIYDFPPPPQLGAYPAHIQPMSNSNLVHSQTLPPSPPRYPTAQSQHSVSSTPLTRVSNISSTQQVSFTSSQSPVHTTVIPSDSVHRLVDHIRHTPSVSNQSTTLNSSMTPHTMTTVSADASMISQSTGVSRTTTTSYAPTLDTPLTKVTSSHGMLQSVGPRTPLPPPRSVTGRPEDTFNLFRGNVYSTGYVGTPGN